MLVNWTQDLASPTLWNPTGFSQWETTVRVPRPREGGVRVLLPISSPSSPLASLGWSLPWSGCVLFLPHFCWASPPSQLQLTNRLWQPGFLRLSLQAWDGNGCPPGAHLRVLHHSVLIPLSLPKPSCVVPLLTSLQWNPLSYAICFYRAPARCNYFKKHSSEWLCCGDHTHRPVREGVADKMTIKACRDGQMSQAATRENHFIVIVKSKFKSGGHIGIL